VTLSGTGLMVADAGALAASMLRISPQMGFLMITGRAWHDLPIVIILGLVIGLAFGHIVKLTSPEPTSIASPAKR
jgi:hypothetical protein